jgi:uncharacterized membrane protein YbaN (DUF454 family)
MIISGSARDGFVAWAADESGNLTSRKTRRSRAHRGSRRIPSVRDAAGGKPQLRFHRRSVEIASIRDHTARAARSVASMLPATIPSCLPFPLKVSPASQIETTTRPRIDCREDLGVIVVHDPRLLRRGREAFCTALVREAVGVCGALRAEVDLASSEFRVEFAPGRFDRAGLAEQVARAVRAATPSACDPTPSRTAWLTLTAFQAECEPSLWETLEGGDGRIVFQHRAMLDAPWLAVRLARALAGLPGVRTCRAYPWSGRVEVEVDARTAAPGVVVAAAETVLRKQNSASRPHGNAASTPPVAPQEPPIPDSRSRRLVDLVLAGGSFTIAAAGFVVPGVPSAPFLLLASQYLVRSAPKTHRQLSRVPGVGRVLRRVGMPIHPGADRRALLATVGWSLLTAVAFVIVHPPLPGVLALEFGLFTLSVARG